MRNTLRPLLESVLRSREGSSSFRGEKVKYKIRELVDGTEMMLEVLISVDGAEFLSVYKKIGHTEVSTMDGMWHGFFELILIDALQVLTERKKKPSGYLFEGKFYADLSELNGVTMSEGNHLVPLYTREK